MRFLILVRSEVSGFGVCISEALFACDCGKSWGLVPIALKMFGLDSAKFSPKVLTTITDVTGVI
ncbi:hypothetical protein D9603_16660 [Pseudoalteromonas sp. PS5]|nr:hypothetical protein D9603_16660 [Pseudoalteromonas sp. PS5]